MAIAVNEVRDVADGPRPGQFEVGDRTAVERLDQLDPVYRQLLDGPVTAVVSVLGSTGASHLSPVWFDYEGGLVLLNLASHRRKVAWLRRDPRATFLLMNPQNPYHWVSIRTTAVREVAEDDPDEGPRVTAHIDRMFAKYGGGDGGYALREPGRDERRILFELRVDSVATFGRP